MARDAEPRVRRQDAFQPAAGGRRPVGDDDHAGVDGQPDAHSPAVMDGDPRRAADGVEKGVEHGPVGDGVGAVPHALGLPVRRGHRPRVEMVAPDDDRRADRPLLHETVDDRPEPGPLAVAEPADARRQPLELDLLPGLADPAGQGFVLRELPDDGLVGGVDVPRPSRKRRPAERPLALTEEGADILRDEARDVEGGRDPGFLGLAADIVAVVESPGPSFPQLEHGFDVDGHRLVGAADVAFRVLFPEGQRILVGQAVGNVPVELVVGRGLVGEDIRRHPPADELRDDIGGVAEKGDGQGPAFFHGFAGQAKGLVEAAGHPVDISRVQPPPDAVGIDLDDDGHAVVHGHGQGLGAAHAPQSRRQRQGPPERAPEMPAGRFGQGLVRPLEDALGPDVDPAPGRHLPVHRQAQGFQAAELVPRRPLGHDQGIGDEDPRRLGVGLKDRDRLPGLYDQGLVVLELLKAGDDGPERFPVAGRLAGPSVDDQLAGALRDLGIEVVHQHPEGAFLRPALCVQACPSGGPDRRDRIRALGNHGRPPGGKYTISPEPDSKSRPKKEIDAVPKIGILEVAKVSTVRRRGQ